MKRYSIKITEDVHDRLELFRDKRETFSQAIDRLLKVWEGFHSLSQVVGGMHEFADYKEQQRQKVDLIVDQPAPSKEDVRP